MDPRKWFRRKTKTAPPPAVQFEIPLEMLPPEIRAAIASGAKCTFRQYPARRLNKYKLRSQCVVLLDGEYAAETEVTWEVEPPK